MEGQKKILIVDDDVDTCLLLLNFLAKKNYIVSTAHSGKSALEKLRTEKVDLVISDFRLGDMEGHQILAEIKRSAPETPVIIITGYSEIKTAVNVIKAGAFDYITKPLIPDEILHTVRKALAGNEPQSDVALKKSGKENRKQGLQNDFIQGESLQAKKLLKEIELVAPTNMSVIINGESGAGKEAVARMIHLFSKRSSEPFLALDCGAISKELAGSELFGHEKGAFTGAIDSKVGHFEMANKGTLFLDEIANLPIDVQAALLRVVQERKMRRLGGSKEIQLDVRILVASNENLREAYQGGRFREDLFHRFNEFSLNVPSLRERGADIIEFANHFLRSANAELEKNITGFSEDTIKSFLSYDWPGNIRELKNVVKRGVLLADGELIQAQHLPLEISNPSKFISSTRSQAETKDSTVGASLKNATQNAEYDTIVRVLKQVNYNKTKAALLLNIDRKTLYNKMKGFNLLKDEEE